MQRVDAERFGPDVAKLLADAPLNELGSGAAVLSRRAEMAALGADSVVAPHRLVDREMALVCCAGLWLRYDFFDESHAISQELDTTEGSYWHGILHRREPDYGNAKYWFRRVGAHPTFAALLSAARETAGPAPADKGVGALLASTVWDPFRFIDLCEKASGGDSALAAWCRKIQQREWELLFEHCYRAAIGA